MAKNDSDLFDRLRRAGLRKQAAKTLSRIGEGASKKALGAARSAIADLHSLVDELERRLPSAASDDTATGITVSSISARPAAVAPSASRSGAGGARASGGLTAPEISGARAPRGENKARIMGSLRTGPKTASEVAKETGIGTGTVSTTLTKLAKAGEVVKADRGYALHA